VKNDVTFLAILIGLFVLAFLLVAGCDRIIARDSEALDSELAPGDPQPDEGRTTPEEVAA
jgi:hypothetical protein